MGVGIEGVGSLVQRDKVISGVVRRAGFTTRDVHIVAERHEYIFQGATAYVGDFVLQDEEIVERRVTPLESIDLNL